MLFSWWLNEIDNSSMSKQRNPCFIVIDNVKIPSLSKQQNPYFIILPQAILHLPVGVFLCLNSSYYYNNYDI